MTIVRDAMSDDIVERLRKAEVAGVLIPCDELKEAADEIERLRDALKCADCADKCADKLDALYDDWQKLTARNADMEKEIDAAELRLEEEEAAYDACATELYRLTAENAALRLALAGK